MNILLHHAKAACLCILLVSAAAAPAPAAETENAALQDALKGFIELAGEQTGSWEEMKAKADVLVAQYTEVPREEVYFAMLKAISRIAAEGQVDAIYVRVMTDMLTVKFGLTEEQMWAGTRRLLDFHDPEALYWAQKMLGRMPGEKWEGQGWDGSPYVDVLKDVATTETEKLSVLRMLLQWDLDLAWSAAIEAFAPGAARAEELAVLRAAAGLAEDDRNEVPSYSQAREEQEALGAKELAAQPEPWVRLYAAVAVDWQGEESLLPVLEKLAEDTVPIVSDTAKLARRYVLPLAPAKKEIKKAN
jgi:hypothetical protein